jgi:hypothetical protein
VLVVRRRAHAAPVAADPVRTRLVVVAVDAVAVVVPPVAAILRARMHARIAVIAVEGRRAAARGERTVAVRVEPLVHERVAVVVLAIAHLDGTGVRLRVLVVAVVPREGTVRVTVGAPRYALPARAHVARVLAGHASARIVRHAAPLVTAAGRCAHHAVAGLAATGVHHRGTTAAPTAGTQEPSEHGEYHAPHARHTRS